MKLSRIVSALIISIMLVLLTSCTVLENAKSVSSNKTNDITIYKITMDDFLRFLQEPCDKIFHQNSTEKYNYSEDGDVFFTADLARYKIEHELIDFVSNKKAIKQLLSQNNFNTEITDTIVFDSPISPITIWMKTATTDVFITINENINKHAEYKLYNHSDFKDKFSVKDASFLVNGAKVDGVNSVKLYYNHAENPHAEIPLIATLKVLGASVKNTNSSNINIFFNDQTYHLDISTPALYKADDQTYNLLFVYGGYNIVYSRENELMVDTAILNNVLRLMGEPVFVNCNTENMIVSVNKR